MIIVLFIMQVLTCMALYGVNITDNTWLLSQQRLHRLSQLAAMRDLARDLESQISINNIECLIKPEATSELKSKPLAWWQHYACHRHVGSVEYYWLLEELATHVCAIINGQDEKKPMSIAYYRITIYDANYLLQSTFAAMSHEKLPCVGDIGKVTLGRQVLREL